MKLLFRNCASPWSPGRCCSPSMHLAQEWPAAPATANLDHLYLRFPALRRTGLGWVSRQFVGLCLLLIDCGSGQGPRVSRLEVSLQEGMMAIGSPAKGGEVACFITTWAYCKLSIPPAPPRCPLPSDFPITPSLWASHLASLGLLFLVSLLRAPNGSPVAPL